MIPGREKGKYTSSEANVDQVAGRPGCWKRGGGAGKGGLRGVRGQVSRALSAMGRTWIAGRPRIEE